LWELGTVPVRRCCVRPALDELVSAGLYLDELIYEHLLQAVGESRGLSD